MMEEVAVSSHEPHRDRHEFFHLYTDFFENVSLKKEPTHQKTITHLPVFSTMALTRETLLPTEISFRYHPYRP